MIAQAHETESAFAALQEARKRTLALVDPISEADLVRVHSPLMSPLVWDLGHIAAFEDLWLVHRLGGRPMVRADLATVYDAFETPRAHRGDLPYLGPAQARAYLEEVREQALELISYHGIGDGQLHEMVLRHELQHGETMLQTIQLARLEGYSAVPLDPDPPPGEQIGGSGLQFIEVSGGPCTIGAPPEGFAYDNERPQHRVQLAAFEIGRQPVTNGDYLQFVAGGGYQQREWWSAQAWAWKERERVSRPGGWSEDLACEWRLSGQHPLDPARPVVHVSWFEADAFARAHGARLPSELEWERAATWDPSAEGKRPYPWGEAPPAAGKHANLDQRRPGPVRVNSHPEGESPWGCADLLGQVWEWTASPFTGYEGFAAYPYREYSEVFFGDAYRVLKGGSWATRLRVATPTFRNWDFPQRRQIFAGFRLAK